MLKLYASYKQNLLQLKRYSFLYYSDLLPLYILNTSKIRKRTSNMDQVQDTSVIDKHQEEESSTYSGYHSIITGVNRSWEYGGFPLPDGTFWRYREPVAELLIRNRFAYRSFRKVKNHGFRSEP